MSKVFNWKNFKTLGSKEEQFKAIKEAINFFFQRPLIEKGEIKFSTEKMNALKAAGIKFTVPGDTPNSGDRQIVVSDVFKATPLEDFGYMDIFDLVDMRGIPKDTFEILDASNGITFNQRAPGEEAKIYKVSDSKATVSFLEFAAGLGFLDQWIQFQQYYLLDDVTVQTKNKYYDKMADLHYGLFTALSSGVNQAYDTSDAQTIDNACVQIISDCKSKGYFVKEGVKFVVIANPSLKRRLMKAIWPFAVNPNDASSQAPVNNISQLITTWHLPNTSYYVALPGNKLKRGVWKDLTVESNRDILKSATDFVWCGQYNAAIGDSQQVRRGALS